MSRRERALRLKRLLDCLLASALAVSLSPLLALIVLWILLDDGRPAIFVQPRLGKDGVPFRIYKFRTMVVDADRYLTRDGRVSGSRFTRSGRFLRRFSLDELPQLVNILRGDMSLVGPRPALMQHAERYREREWGRLRMRPGVTGLAQIRGRNTLRWSRRIQLDNWYIDHYSLALDLRILGTTVGQVLFSRGVVLDRNPEQVDDLPRPRTPCAPDSEARG